MDRLRPGASALGIGLALLAGSASADAPFEVIVLRGASVARVSGDASGALREESLREDPRPARREDAPAPRDAGPAIVVVLDAGAAYAPGYALAAPFFFAPGLEPYRHGRPRHVYRPGFGPPRFYRGRTRGHRPRGGGGF